MPENTNNAALADWVKFNTTKASVQTAMVEDGREVPYIVALNGAGGHVLLSLKALEDERRTRPTHFKGTATLLDIASFIAHVQRQKHPFTVIFAQTAWPSPALVAVYDYNDPARVEEIVPSDVEGEPDETAIYLGKPRFGVHRAVYAFPVSKEWTIWNAKSGPNSKMTQQEFAEHIEDNILDVVTAPAGEITGLGSDLIKAIGGRYADASQLLELSRGMAVHSSDRVKSAVNISTGEVQVVYENEHQDAGGAPLVVPNLFMIGIPVFEGGPAYMIGARLRYRLVGGGKLTWWYELFKPQKVADHAIAEALEAVRVATAVPVFLGKPEGS